MIKVNEGVARFQGDAPTINSEFLLCVASFVALQREYHGVEYAIVELKEIAIMSKILAELVFEYEKYG